MHHHTTTKVHRTEPMTDWSREGVSYVRLDLVDQSGRDLHVYVRADHALARVPQGATLKLVAE